MVTSTDRTQRFDDLLAEFDGMPGLGRGQAFGSPVIKVNGKIAASFRDGRLVLKLPPDRIATLIEQQRGEPFSAYGKTMSGWIALSPETDDDWGALTEEAIDFVRPT